MAKFDDFDLDVTKTAARGGIEPKYKSKSACKYKFTVGTAWILILVSAILILKAAPVECINRELDDTEKEHCKKVTMKVLSAVIVFAGCCTLAGISDILSLVALTSFIILISQYVGILKYKIEKSKNKRR